MGDLAIYFVAVGGIHVSLLSPESARRYILSGVHPVALFDRVAGACSRDFLV